MAKRSNVDHLNCSIARSLEIVGEWWSLLIVRDAFLGIRRFDDFQRDLGISRNILSDRLATLVEHGIFERRRYQEHPERFEYRLTQKGVELYPVIVSLLRWGDKWESPDGPPLRLRAHHLRPRQRSRADVLALPRAARPSRGAAPPWAGGHQGAIRHSLLSRVPTGE